MKCLQFFLFAFGLACTHATFAARPNYTYLGLGYAFDKLDGGCDQDGLYLEGSLVLSELTFIQLHHTDVTSSSWCGSTTTSFSGGVRSDIGGSSSLYGTASLLHRDYGNNSDTGAGVNIGLRSLILFELEVNGLLGYESIDGYEVSYIGAGINYWLSQAFSLSAGMTLNDEDDKGVTVGLRYNF